MIPILNVQLVIVLLDMDSKPLIKHVFNVILTVLLVMVLLQMHVLHVLMDTEQTVVMYVRNVLQDLIVLPVMVITQLHVLYVLLINI